MASSLALRVKWSEQTSGGFGPRGFNIPWDEEELLEVRCPEPPLTINGIGTWIEARVEGLYSQMTGGLDEGQVQVISMRRAGDSQSDTLPWGDHADQHLRNGDVIVVDCQLASDMLTTAARQRRLNETANKRNLSRIRAFLRFALNDRVLCFWGSRWFSGVVVGTAVPHGGEVLPYLVKTDPSPELSASTISVPSDRDELCTREICFHPHCQLHLVQAAAEAIEGSAWPRLRFTVGDKVVCRIGNSAEDGLEQWVEGKVSSTWPKLTKRPQSWEIGGVVGVFPDTVPYKVDFSDGGWVYCHRDNFTLIRQAGMQPRERVRGISKRMEVFQAVDGSREQVDHHTGRRKRLRSEFADDDSDSD